MSNESVNSESESSEAAPHDADANINTPLRARLSYPGLLLGAVCLSMTIALLLGFQLTRKGIDEAALQDKLASLAQVLPTTLYNNNPVQEVRIINDTQLSEQPTEVYLAKRDGTLTGIAFQLKRPGYGGPITLIIGLDAAGNVLGARVISHKETPGLADRIDIAKDDWITAFNGHSLSNTSTQAWHVKKDGGEFDQFTGATITPRAVVGAIYQGLLFHQRHFLGNAMPPPTVESAHE